MPDKRDVRPADSDLERRRLLCVLSEALDKLYRVDAILGRQQIFVAAAGVKGGSASAVDTLVAFLEDHRQTFLNSSDAVADFLQGKPTNEAQILGVLAALGILIRSILQVHELLLLLPREAAMPQASFALRDCFGPKYSNVSIVLTNSYSAYEYRFEDILKKINIEQEERDQLKQGGNVLCQAFADKDNALAWAVLAHEFGHSLNDEHSISQSIFPGEGWDAQMIGETVADFVAAHVLGPASLLPILFIEMMQPQLKVPDTRSAGHPPTPLRVQLVRDYLSGLGVETDDFEKEFQVYEYDYNWKVERVEKGKREGLQKRTSEIEQLLKSKSEEIASKVNKLGLLQFNRTNADRAREAARELQTTADWGQPIASRRARSDTELYEALDALKCGETTIDRAYEVLAGFDELPVPSAEILTAGWIYRLSSFEAKLMETFPGAGKKPSLEVYSDYVKNTDRRLLKSLELAAVHTDLLRERPGAV
jgi:hypothetical protein